MLEQEGDEQQRAEAANPATCAQRLEVLSSDSSLRRIVAGNPAASAHLLEHLAQDQDEEVRQAVASNPNTSWKTLEFLAWEFPHAFFSNPVGQLQIMADPGQVHTKDNEFWEALMRAAPLPPLWLSWIRSHPSPNVHEALHLHVQHTGETPFFIGDPREQDVETQLTLLELLAAARTQGAALPPLPGVTANEQSLIPCEQVIDEYFQRLAHHRSWWVREALAMHPQTPVTLLCSMAEDENSRVRWMVAENSQTPGTVLQMLAQDQDINVRSAIAGNAYLPAEILHTLAQDKASEVRANVVWNEHTSAEMLQILALDQDSSVRSAVASHWQTPVNMLQALAQDPSDGVRATVARNRRTPAKVLQSLVQDEVEYVRRDVAGNEQTPREAFQSLARDEDEQVRWQLAENPLLSTDLLEVLARDQDVNVRRAVASHLQIPLNSLLLLASDQEASVRRAVAWHERTPTRILQALSQDQEASVRRTVAWHERTPGEVFQSLLQDPDATVRWTADLIQWLLIDAEGPLGAQAWEEKRSLLHLYGPEDGRVIDEAIEKQLEWIVELEVPEHIRETILATLANSWERDRVLRAFEVYNMASTTIRRMKRENYQRLMIPFMPPVALQKLAASRFWEIRYLVALHERTPFSTRQRLSQDGNRYVRAMARACLHGVPNEEGKNDGAHSVEIFD